MRQRFLAQCIQFLQCPTERCREEELAPFYTPMSGTFVEIFGASRQYDESTLRFALI